ncbi:hypothetical protein NPIL_164741 [Nephila pilipes]|uniref:PiggyBac transposable element-derived protein domain-containing protein n=1 Tax=Nephila pilipes TaxID=299642 RepID=A0A8X6NRU0_NEPPI|nr:hypothetical protein NPIL_164741 [Nephila pilipes]
MVPFLDKSKNVTTDNFFTSLTLVEKLKQMYRASLFSTSCYKYNDSSLTVYRWQHITQLAKISSNSFLNRNEYELKAIFDSLAEIKNKFAVIKQVYFEIKSDDDFNEVKPLLSKIDEDIQEFQGNIHNNKASQALLLQEEKFFYTQQVSALPFGNAKRLSLSLFLALAVAFRVSNRMHVGFMCSPSDSSPSDAQT